MILPLNPVAFVLSTVVLVAALQAEQTAPSAPSPAKDAIQSLYADFGAVADGIYRNPFFGFTLKLPFGWVDRTDVMRQDSSDTAKPGTGKGIVLLAAFERPPEATGTTVNSAVVIAAESVSSYPRLEDPAQYFGPIEEVTKSNGFTAVNEPYEFPFDGMPIVRQDFSKKLNSLTMYQSSLVILRKGYIVSFTFIAGSEDEITQNLECLRFGGPKPPKHK
jgi:hypothetical protein